MKQSVFEKHLHINEWASQDVEEAIIAAYTIFKGLDCSAVSRISDNNKHANRSLVEEILRCFNDEFETVDLYLVVDLFETIVSESEKKGHGIVYTPYIIQKLIIENLFKKASTIPTICDPSCGCGSFLLTAARWIRDEYNINYGDIFSKYIVGIELSQDSVRQATFLFDLLIMENGELPPVSYNIICGDSTNKKILDEIIERYGFFDYVIGNPPYVRSRNLGQEGKENFHYWKSAATGNVDLYIPFFEIGLYLLKRNGELGYISPNTFMQAVNGRGLREQLIKNNNLIRIIDFRDSQIFAGVTSYTCIVWIKKEAERKILYSRIKSPEDIIHIRYDEYSLDDFAPNKRWRMFESLTSEMIYKLEHAGRSLDSWKLRNGLATLKNDLFFFTPCEEETEYYCREYKGIKYRIEKAICIDVAKPNVIKNEIELNQKLEKAIFPYAFENGSLNCIEEEMFKKNYPKAYSFISAYKDELSKRDKGKGKYPKWYAYGRTQGMNNFGKKLLIPYISGEPIAVLCTDPNVLFYCGYALISDSEEELRIIKYFMESDAFWFYISTTSKPYAKGYMALAKNYIAKFTIPKLTDDEKEWLLSNPEKRVLNSWIWGKYGIDKK